MTDHAPRDYIKRLGMVIVSSRKQKQISQEELADMIGISRPTMRSIENGESKVAFGSYVAALSWLGRLDVLNGVFGDLDNGER